MPKRGVSSGRKKQLKRHKRNLLGHRRFNPAIFDQGQTGLLPRSYKIEKQRIAPLEPARARENPAVTKSLRRFEQLLAPSVSVVPGRLPTRPLPVARQIRRPVATLESNTRVRSWVGPKPKIRSVRSMSLTIRRDGNRLIVGLG